MLSISVLQINATRGAFQANAEKISEASLRAKEEGANLLVAPLGALSGYPVGSYARRVEFLLRQKAALVELSKKLAVPALFGMVPGLVFMNEGKARFVVPGEVLEIAGSHVGVLTGLDALEENLADLKRNGADVVVIAAANEYRKDRPAERIAVARKAAVKAGLSLLFVNLVGGADQSVFDGASFAVNAAGNLTALLESCAECFTTVNPTTAPTIEEPQHDSLGELYSALSLALSDYVQKNGFNAVQIGLSGGVDSALVATIATDALGADAVHALMMPTQFTADLSLTEAEKLAKNLGIDYKVRPIGPLFESYRKELSEDFAGLAWDATEENLQARIRGNLLMAYANKFKRLVIATSNKSESAAGYATLYGDTVGAFEAISDVYKTEVWALCRWRNAKAGTELIPQSIIDRAPSAELREGQKDSQSLPEYDVLDAVLNLYVEEGLSVSEIVKRGFDQTLVERIVRMTHTAEFKRRQCPIGAKVSKRAFSDASWNYPMTIKLKD